LNPGARNSDNPMRGGPPITEARRKTVEVARQSWIRKLIDLSRRNNLLYFRPLKTGTLDLSTAPDPRRFKRGFPQQPQVNDSVRSRNSDCAGSQGIPFEAHGEPEPYAAELPRPDLPFCEVK
jgi:hypothetical protein